MRGGCQEEILGAGKDWDGNGGGVHGGGHHPQDGLSAAAESGGIPPARLADAARASRYLSLRERQRIATLRGNGHTVREIARRIDRAPSTVSRELRRKLLRHDHDIYDGDLAHARAGNELVACVRCC